MTTARTEPTSTPSSGSPPSPPSTSTPSRMPDVLWLIISREVRVRARSKAFIISTLTSLVLLVGLIVVPTLLGSGPTTYEVGVVGEGNTALVDSAARLANIDAPEGERTTIEVIEHADVAAAELAVEDGEVGAALIDGAVLVVPRAGGFASSALADLLQQAAAAEAVTELVGEADAARVDAALAGDALEVVALSGQDAAHADGRTWLAYGGVFLTYLLIIQYGSWTMSGVTEEKTNRVIEILLSTARPWQLFAGKVIGVGILGIGQFAVTMAVALTAIRVTGAFELPALPVAFAGVLTLWVLVGFALYLVLFGAAGALAAKMEDAQSAMSPIITLLVIGFGVSFFVLSTPDGAVAVVGTFIPLTAPFVVPVRAALEAIPLWQHGLALVLSLAAVVALTGLSSRVYRGGALQFAGKVGWRQALRRAG